MARWLLILFVSIPVMVNAQTGNKPFIRSFPITEYMVELNDSMKLVQVYLEQSGIIVEKQVGLLRSVYSAGEIKPDIIGSGRCHLIKGPYYYFSINIKESGVKPQKGDLLYVGTTKPTILLDRIIKVAAHSIGLTDVYDSLFYDRNVMFNAWSATNENAVLDSMINDIKYTADYFIKNDPSMNVKIKSGVNEGKLVLNIMMASTSKELKAFLDYIIVFPRKYAGHNWKISEIFATWLSEGSPTP